MALAHLDSMIKWPLIENDRSTYIWQKPVHSPSKKALEALKRTEASEGKIKSERLVRLLELVTMFQSGVVPDVDTASEALGISRRTFFRDLNILKESGIPCYHDSTQGYRISSAFFMPPIQLQASEAIGLMLLLKLAWDQKHHPFIAQATAAIRKFLATAPLPIRDVCAELTNDISIFTPRLTVGDAQAERVSTLLHAIGERKIVECQHYGIADCPTRLEIKPYHLAFSDMSWHLIAHCGENLGVRTLRMSDLSGVRLLPRHYADQPAFDIQSYIGNAWRLMPEGKTYSIELLFDAAITPYITSVQWHPTQQHRVQPDGSCIMSFEIDGLSEITNWIWGYGIQVRVLKPAALRERIRQRCQDLLSHEQITPSKCGTTSSKAS